MQCGAACLHTILRIYGRYDLSLTDVSSLCEMSRDGVSIYSINKAAQGLGFETLCGIMPPTTLAKIPLPAILFWRRCHFVVLLGIEGGKYIIGDPARGVVKVTPDELHDAWQTERSGDEECGIALLLEPTDKFKRSGRYSNNGVLGTMRFLWGYFSPFKSDFVKISISLLICSLIQLALPITTQLIVDKGIAARDINLVWLLIAGQLMLTLGRALAAFGRGRVLLRVGMSVYRKMGGDFLDKLTRLPMTFFDTRQTGDLVQRIGDLSRAQDFFTAQVLPAIFAIFSVIVFGAVMSFYSWWILLAFAVCCAAMAGWFAIFIPQRRSADYDIFESNAVCVNTTFRYITTVQEIKIQGCEERRKSEWYATQTNLMSARERSLRLNQTQEAGSVILNETRNVVITLISAMAVIDGGMTLGMMLAAQYIAGQMAEPMDRLARFAYSFQDVGLSLERICGIHQMADEDAKNRTFRNSEMSGGKGISINHLSFRYEGEQSNTLTDISIDIPAGKVTAIVGASGAGKTTLLKLLLGYYSPTEGRITIGGVDINELNHKEWRKRCGVVTQEGVIFTDTIERNIAADDDNPDKERVRQAAQMAMIASHIESLTAGYDTMIGPDGRNLSRGQAQRLLLARAIYRQPQYMMLDEATNSLDADNEREIIGNLADFYRGRTVILIAHRLSTVRNADQIICLRDGRVVETGTHESLVAAHGYYHELVKDQLELGT